MSLPLVKIDLNDPVTRYRRQDFTALGDGLTVGEALDWLRAHPPAGRIAYFYVVDGEGRLVGVVPTRGLVLSTPETHLADIMVRRLVVLPEEATVLEACEFFIQHRLLALPVVDGNRHILGVVDVDLYTGELWDLSDAKAQNDLFQTIGVHLVEDVHTSPWSAFRRRFPWLGCNLGAGIVAALLSGIYADELHRVVALAFFIPVVLNLAESVSSQSVSLALQGLREQRPTWKSLAQRLRRELLTGLLLGIGSGAVLALTAMVWLGEGRLALCLLGGVAVGVAGAAALGLALPILLRLLHLEPRIAAGPVALAGADLLTILVYFNLARWLLG